MAPTSLALGLIRDSTERRDAAVRSLLQSSEGSWCVSPVRKLAVFDTWSALAVHIAMDNTVVMEDISK